MSILPQGNGERLRVLLPFHDFSNARIFSFNSKAKTCPQTQLSNHWDMNDLLGFKKRFLNIIFQKKLTRMPA